MIDIPTLREFQDLRDTKVYEYLREQFGIAVTSLAKINDNTILRQMQGKSQQLMELIALIDNASDEIEKAKASQRSTAGMF